MIKPNRCKHCTLLRVDKVDQTCEECLSYMPRDNDSNLIMTSMPGYYFVNINGIRTPIPNSLGNRLKA